MREKEDNEEGDEGEGWGEVSPSEEGKEGDGEEGDEHDGEDGEWEDEEVMIFALNLPYLPVNICID